MSAPELQPASWRGRLAGLLRSVRRHPGRALGVLLVGALVLRLIWIWWPQDSTIFDESYYVNASRVMLGRDVPSGSPYEGATPGIDPNSEHPPLGKALIALSIASLGDGGIGWRIPSVIAGMIALLAIYGIVRASGESAWLGVVAVALFALDNLAFVHSRMGTLDMLFLAPILVGAWLALRGRWALAGAACAVGTLVKLTGAFGLFAILLLEILAIGARWRAGRAVNAQDVRPLLVASISFAVLFLGGLWLLDLAFTGYPDPVSHLQHMLAYGSSLQAPNGPVGIASNPWQWLVNDVEINYLRVAVDTTVDGAVVASQTTIDFRGAMNPILIGAAPIAILYALWATRHSLTRLPAWCLVWAAANYLPYYVLVLAGHRITYLYYFLPVIPAVAVAVALLVLRGGLPRLVQGGFLAAAVAGFVAYFPFRQLP